MSYRLLLLGGMSFLGACSKHNESPGPKLSPAETAVNKVVGSYTCRAYRTNWQTGTADVTTRLRDTIIQVSRVDTNTVQTGAVSLDFRSNMSTLGYSGKSKKFANNAGFATYGGSTSYQGLQLDAYSDSLYYVNDNSAHFFGSVWTFYGKRVK
ncbi:hypothetical protein [Hymenobacter rubidus]|uniref:hypothetical protein n=1 Tax=Hymenobacter rubidus TaxID=1441626 RepID=UPI00191D919C|nr:hypothetical protein [Hymenobacter rubidus]